MLTSERKHAILRVLKKDGRFIAKDFSQSLGVSEDTIRRDLRDLAAAGLLQRVHGGALPASSAIADYGIREHIKPSEKDRLGHAAAQMIHPDQIVFLDGGTTNLQIARHLPHDLRATIVTHSPSIAVELVQYPNIDIELIGGRVFKHSIVAVGTASAEAISRIRTDTYFMGATGIHPEIGITTGNSEEAAIKRLISSYAAETIILATQEKIGAVSAYNVIPMTDVSTVVVESTLSTEASAPFRKSGVSLIRA